MKLLRFFHFSSYFGFIKVLASFIRQRPRTSASVAYGCATALAMHFNWLRDARWSGHTPILTATVGLAYALAGAITAPHLVSRTRTAGSLKACLIGAGTSLLAVVLLSPSIAIWIEIGNARPQGALSFLSAALFAGLFFFLAAGWALLFVSAAVGCCLYRLTCVNP